MRCPNRLLLLVASALLGLSVLPAGAATATARVVVPASVPVSVPASDQVTFTGHGWGHGRGMGQYGALGYALGLSPDGPWTFDRILHHYYGGTVLRADAGNPTTTVELTRFTNRDTIVQGPGLTVNGTGVGAGYGYLLVRRVGPGQFQPYTAPGCGGPWTPWGGVLPSGVRIATTGDQARHENLLRTCESGVSYGYRGTFSVTEVGSSVFTLNVLPLQSYLRGVVPRESPASWGSLGGGRGIEALKAQAVAARSYALSSARRPSGAAVCDTTACQVYSGAFSTRTDGPAATRTTIEQAATDTAIAHTAGHVMRFTATGAIARTEFSSSTGGWTTGGTFPAVADLGDAVSNNPNHTWTATYTLGDVAARLALPGVRTVQVTARNGLGDMGGRVTQVRVVDGTGSTHTYSGAQFRTAMGTDRFKSDWFSVSMVPREEAEKVVRALYRDVLGRGVDPTGLAFWTDYVVRTGDTPALVRQIAESRERMNKLVAAQYRVALNRSPEPHGLEFWVAHLESGRGVYDLQVGIFSSEEAFAKLGAGDTRRWVGELYTRILGRTSNASEREFWAAVAARSGRPAVVEGIARSDEATLRRLDAYYRTFLLRSSDPAGRATFLPLMTGRGDFDIPVHLGSSPEYWARAQTRAV